jgi:hypothetical protein
VIVSILTEKTDMRKLPLMLVLAGVLVGYGTVTWARGDGGSVGGMDADHESRQGLNNSNGPLSADRDKGLQRAEDRESKQGLAHEKATRHKHSKHGKHSKDTDRDRDTDRDTDRR